MKQHDDIHSRLHSALKKEKAYLDPTLTLARLSLIVGTNTTYLSNLINQRYGRNFRTLVNDFRIGYAIYLLTGKRMPFQSKDFCRKCGFASTSVFYDAFKQRMGTSPVRWISRRDNREVADYRIAYRRNEFHITMRGGRLDMEDHRCEE